MRNPSLCKNLAYHIFNRSISKMIIYKDSEDYGFFKLRIEQYKKKYKVEVIAHCVMPNHYHLILRSAEGPKNISKFMQCLQQSYSRKYNYKYDHSGHVFQGAYKHVPIKSNLELARVIKYIAENPVKAGLVKRPEEWPHSG